MKVLLFGAGAHAQVVADILRAQKSAGEKVTFGEVRSPEDTIATLDAVTYDDVREVARGISGPPAVACVGPHEAADFE